MTDVKKHAQQKRNKTVKFSEKEILSILREHISDYDYFRLIFASPNNVSDF